MGFHACKDTSKQSQPGSRIKDRKPGVWPRFPCSGKARLMSPLLHIPAPRAKSGKVLQVPGKKSLSEISGTPLEIAIIYDREDVCGVCKGATPLPKSRQWPKSTQGLLRARDTHTCTCIHTCARPAHLGQTWRPSAPFPPQTPTGGRWGSCFPGIGTEKN